MGMISKLGNAIDLLSSYGQIVYVKNSDGYLGDEGPVECYEVLLISKGSLDLRSMMKTLEEEGYMVSVTIQKNRRVKVVLYQT